MRCRYDIEKPCKNTYKDCADCRVVSALQELRHEIFKLILPVSTDPEEEKMYDYANDTLAMVIARIDKRIEKYMGIKS